MFTIMAMILGAITFAINFAYGRDVISNLIYVIGVIVANVPEGLMITMTLCMALSA